MRALAWLICVVGVLSNGGGVALAQATREAPAVRTPAEIIAARGAKPRAERPTAFVKMDSCVTAECHANVKQARVLHGPVNVNACDACHKVADPAAHTFELTRNKTELCTFCHKVETPVNAVVHQPLKEGNCLGCHDPHGGPTARFLRGKTMAETCAACHKDPMAGKKSVHGPVAAGTCDACHAGHSAPLPKLLNLQGRDLCMSCHTDMKNQLASVKFQHKAVQEGDCMKCHDAHASNFTMQVKEEPAKLCGSCHEKQALAGSNAKHKHSVMNDAQSCSSCHNAHGSDRAKLMRADTISVCMKCHDKPIDLGKGRVVAAVKEVTDPKTIKHGPIRDRSCGGCHEPHGSEESRLLTKAYPETFYQKFELEKYDLCFTCHDKQLVLTENAKGLTGFRNGEQNLHFVHVNKSDKGRNCRACHSTHASNHELHVRESVPYGKWEMPINFRKTDGGGSCSPGCHKPYDLGNGCFSSPSLADPCTSWHAEQFAPLTGPCRNFAARLGRMSAMVRPSDAVCARSWHVRQTSSARALSMCGCPEACGV